MNNNQLTKERLQEIAEDGFLKHGESKVLARIALAAMDSEPVAEITEDLGRLFVKIHYPTTLKAGDKLYRHAQPVPVVNYVPLGDSPYDVPYSMPSNLREFIDQEIGILFSEDDAQGVWIACRRAAMLAAAQQSPGSEPATVPGKWIPVSEQMPDCWCLTCRPVTLNDMRFVVCPDCGNKRCPRANDHRNACTGSNEPGQEGSAHPDTPQEVKGE